MQPSIYLGPPDLELEGSELIEGSLGELDAFSCKLLVSYPAWRAGLATAGFVKSQLIPSSYGFHSMWVNAHRVIQVSAGKAIVEVSCLGLSENSQKKKTIFSSTTQTIEIGGSYEPIRVFSMNPVTGTVTSSWGDPVYNRETSQWVQRQNHPVIHGEALPGGRGSIMRGKPSIKLIWFATTRPPSISAGTAVTPTETQFDDGDPFTDSDSNWLDFKRNYPSGWVIESMEVDPLFVVPAVGVEEDPGYIAEYGLWACTQSLVCRPVDALG